MSTPRRVTAKAVGPHLLERIRVDESAGASEFRLLALVGDAWRCVAYVTDVAIGFTGGDLQPHHVEEAVRVANAPRRAA